MSAPHASHFPYVSESIFLISDCKSANWNSKSATSAVNLSRSDDVIAEPSVLMTTEFIPLVETTWLIGSMYLEVAVEQRYPWSG